MTCEVAPWLHSATTADPESLERAAIATPASGAIRLLCARRIFGGEIVLISETGSIDVRVGMHKYATSSKDADVD